MTGDTVVIRAAGPADAAPIATIYNHYVRETIVTFEEEPVPPEEMARRIAEVQGRGLPWLVADLGGMLVGYAYATPWRSRFGYRFSVEVTVYTAPGQERRGIGSRLYQALLPMLETKGVHAAMGGIALPNDASIASTRNSVSGRWRTSGKRESSSAGGSTSGTGSGCSARVADAGRKEDGAKEVRRAAPPRRVFHPGKEQPADVPDQPPPLGGA